MKKFILVLFLSLIAAYSHSAFKQIEVKGQKKIRWVIAHEPKEYFLRGANRFKEIIERETKGAVTLEIQLKSPYDLKENEDYHTLALKQVLSGQSDMIQIYTDTLAKTVPEMNLLSLPFLFKDHDHVTKTVEGPVGGQLLAKLEPMHLKGLGFTYSGGHRVVPAKIPIRRFEDFKGLRHRALLGAVNQDVMKLLGAQPIHPDLVLNGKWLGIVGQFEQGIIDSADSTYADAQELLIEHKTAGAKYLNVTHHMFLMTAVVMNKDFYDKLSKDEQEAVKKAALEAARAERDVIAQDEKRIAKLVGNTKYEIVHMSTQEKQRFKQAMSPIYEKYGAIIGQELIQEVTSMQ